MPLPELHIGDRVRDAKRTTMNVFTEKSPNFREASRCHGARRSGVVVGFQERPMGPQRTALYVQVQWDHLKSPSLHARFRLEKVEPEQGCS